MSLRDDILNSPADPFLELRPEPVPEWGGLKVYYRGWTGTERDEFEEKFGDIKKVGGRRNLRARILVRYLLDEKGERIFADEDAGALGKKNGVVIDRLWTLLMRANGMISDDAEDDLKNSEAGPAAGSTGSLRISADIPA